MSKGRHQRLDAEGDWSERYRAHHRHRRLRDTHEDDTEEDLAFWEREAEAKEKHDQDEIERLEAERDRP